MLGDFLPFWSLASPLKDRGLFKDPDSKWAMNSWLIKNGGGWSDHHVTTGARAPPGSPVDSDQLWGRRHTANRHCLRKQRRPHRPEKTPFCRLQYGGFLKWWYPQIINFNRVFHYKPSILGYPYFWKHPYVHTYGVSRKPSRVFQWMEHGWNLVISKDIFVM